MDEKNIPELTLQPDLIIQPKAAENESVKPAPAGVEDTPLTEEEREAVRVFAEKIDLTDSAVILQYGASSQKKIAGFSESALEKVRTKDLGEVGGMLTGLVSELRGFDTAPEKNKGIFGFFGKAKRQMEEMKTRYNKVEANVGQIETALESHQVQLLKDIATLDKMYEVNLAHFKELSMYILAGKRKLEEVRTSSLPALIEKATASGLPEDAQAAKDLDNMCSRFEKKIYDLELTRNISIQMAPQIRLVQNNDAMMAEKIQSSIVNTIPLWKSQMVLALGLANSQQAIAAQRAVTDMTNQLLERNAAMLKQGSVDAARESERGIVDIETLQKTNQSLIETLDEVIQIQDEGRTKRHEAEQELGRIEGELKAKLLELHS